MQRYADRLRAEGERRLQVRVGVNTGEVVVRSIKTGDGHTEYTPIGHSDQSRVADADASADRVRSRSVRARASWSKAISQFRPLGPAQDKGVSEPVEVYEVTGSGRCARGCSAQRGGG